MHVATYLTVKVQLESTYRYFIFASYKVVIKQHVRE